METKNKRNKKMNCQLFSGQETTQQTENHNIKPLVLIVFNYSNTYIRFKLKSLHLYYCLTLYKTSAKVNTII